MAGDRIDQVVQEIAARHGVVVGRDDPILMLVTLNERLLRDGDLAQRDAIAKFSSELEGMVRRVSDEAKTQAEVALQATLDAGQQALAHAVQENTGTISETVRAQIESSAHQIQQQIQHARQVGIMVLGGSLVVLAAAFVVAWGGR